MFLLLLLFFIIVFSKTVKPVISVKPRPPTNSEEENVESG